MSHCCQHLAWLWLPFSEEKVSPLAPRAGLAVRGREITELLQSCTSMAPVEEEGNWKGFSQSHFTLGDAGLQLFVIRMKPRAALPFDQHYPLSAEKEELQEHLPKFQVSLL